MVTTIHTKKSVYQDNATYQKEKEKLFHNLSVKMIINELKKNDIMIDSQQISDTYRQNYDINKTIDLFDDRFDQQLDQLALKNEVFDDDALVYLIIKVIEHDFDVHSIPDIAYIARDIKALLEHVQSYQSLMKQIRKILKRLLALSQYHESRDLENMLAPYGIDLEQVLVQAFQDIGAVDDVRLLKELYELMISLRQTYEVSKRYCDIILELMSHIVLYDQSDIGHYLQMIEKNDPEYLLMAYYKVLNALSVTHQNELVRYYFDQAMTYQPENEEQEDLLDIINEIFA